ncbi:MAG: DNA topoisomerase VI, partial [Candidatus Brocadiia bacterium]
MSDNGKAREAILSCAGDIKERIGKGKKPSLKFPRRSLSNITYDTDEGYFKLKSGRITRTLTYNTVKTFAQVLRMMALSKEAIDTEEEVTKREAYYVSKNWSEARFDEQSESDTVMEDIEALFAVNREQLGFIPEEKGGEV